MWLHPNVSGLLVEKQPKATLPAGERSVFSCAFDGCYG
jgi:hypothetical protein